MPLIFRHNEPKPGHCIYYKYGRRVKSMYSRLIIDGNAVYEIDEECIQKKKNRGFKERKSREENRKGEKNDPIR
mgnify:FL=1